MKIRHTVIIVACAGLAFIIALGVHFSRSEIRDEIPSVQFGENPRDIVFPRLTNESNLKSVEISYYDPEEAQQEIFRLQYHDDSVDNSGKRTWTVEVPGIGREEADDIRRYPVDNLKNLGAITSAFIGLKYTKFVAQTRDDHVAMGVVDPSGEGYGENDNLDPSLPRGLRIKIEDMKGSIVVDLILGAEDSSDTKLTYIRLPNQTDVYAAPIRRDFNTDIASWLEATIFPIEETDILELEIDPYKTNFSVQKTIFNRVAQDVSVSNWGEAFSFSRTSSGAEWVSKNRLIEKKGLDKRKVSDLIKAIDELAFINVYAIPDNLLSMETSPGNAVSRARARLMNLGFAFAQSKQRDKSTLVGKDGAFSIRTKNGITYRLVIGGRAIESSMAKSTSDAGEDSEPKDDDPGYYALAFVSYDAENDESIEERKDNEEEISKNESDGFKLYKKLTSKYSSWMYVIPSDKFDDLVHDKSHFVKSDKD